MTNYSNSCSFTVLMLLIGTMFFDPKVFGNIFKAWKSRRARQVCSVRRDWQITEGLVLRRKGAPVVRFLPQYHGWRIRHISVYIFDFISVQKMGTIIPSCIFTLYDNSSASSWQAFVCFEVYYVYILPKLTYIAIFGYQSLHKYNCNINNIPKFQLRWILLLTSLFISC